MVGGMDSSSCRFFTSASHRMRRPVEAATVKVPSAVTGSVSHSWGEPPVGYEATLGTTQAVAFAAQDAPDPAHYNLLPACPVL